MALAIIIRGHKLTQQQLDAITPCVDANMQGQYRGIAKFEAACIEAMQKANCPLPEGQGSHVKEKK